MKNLLNKFAAKNVIILTANQKQKIKGGSDSSSETGDGIIIGEVDTL